MSSRWIAALALAVLASCGSGPRAATPPRALNADERAAASRAGDEALAHWERRADEAEARAAIEAWTRVAAAQPDRIDVAVSLAHAHFFLADGHLVFRKAADADARAEYLRALDAGAAAAEAGLRARWPAFDDKRALGVPFGDAFVLVADDPDAAPLLYWWAQCRMLASHERGMGATLAEYDTIFRVMEHVATLDPAYWYGGADRYFGVVYAAVPAVAGGDLERSRDHFAAARQRAPGFLETRLLEAMFLGDPSLMAAVARGDGADDDPAIAPEQAIVQRKAGMLLAARPTR